MDINKILVVDESAADRMDLKNILLDAGYEVIEASNGQEAVEKAIAEKPELIFLEVPMQLMDVYQVCREIVRGEKTKHIPILFVANEMISKADKMWLEMSGARLLIQKPYTLDQVIELMNQFK